LGSIPASERKAAYAVLGSRKAGSDSNCLKCDPPHYSSQKNAQRGGWARKLIVMDIIPIGGSVRNSTDLSRFISVYDGRACVGQIQVAPSGEARAFDCHGKPLGIFPTKSEALSALTTVELEAERRP
jgi:hypothetical protein